MLRNAQMSYSVELNKFVSTLGGNYTVELSSKGNPIYENWTPVQQINLSND